MFFKNEETLNDHDYFKAINDVYPKLKKNLTKIINSFELNQDASKYFVDYFAEGHNRIHLILGENYPCNKVNQLLNELLFSVIKFDKNNENYEIPNLFHNFHAVHYYHNIKNKIDYLCNENFNKDQIIEYLVIWERERHQNKECDCGEDHELLATNQLKDLFLQILEYYFSVNINFYKNSLDKIFSSKGMKILN